MQVTNEMLMQKIDLVVNKLMNLGGADYSKDKLASTESTKAGDIARDFGIQEWDWPQGVGLYGLQKLGAYLGDNRYDQFLDEWYQSNIKIGLPSKNVNTTAPFLTLCNILDRMDNPEYEQMCLDRAEWLMSGLPKTRENGFQHVTSAIGDRNGVILNEGQLWADTLFMTVLFLNKMGHKYHRQDWIDEAVHQFLVHIKYLYDKQSRLFYHGWSFERNDNFGGIFWCRGNSWFTFGVIDFLESFDGDLDRGTEKFLVDTFKAQVTALKELQLQNGLWPTVLTDPESYGEVSGTAAIATGILKGIKMGILDESFQECADRAIAAVCENVAEDGTVLNVSAGTGMGMDADHYRNIILAPMAYGQSLSLVALCTALK
ncbi:glycoside hydrolase family 88/105 protein [Cuneatibacter caecimuris]|uniref:Unsaturated rhamnogalacturonyl hydrolase n=1 Tax=Cuneatibacter caecimuris TaxID=1796618 RepID=A0A4Q7PPP1_9FIRM|nr:glycoside hydrolase family 88 protein [Cuneatibacter caecimuris]RZT02256.1 unsaturated rhamnogalacturonyl hydrolase [Cuneatibacter caecimuris]